MTTLTAADLITRTKRGVIILHGTTGVDYAVSNSDLLDENLRTCTVPDDIDLLLDARTYLEFS